MIYDSISNLEKYGGLFADVLGFIEKNDVRALPAGRYDVAEGVYVDVQDYNTKLKSDDVCEVHKKYTDLQYIVRGAEKMYYGVYVDDEPRIPYNEKKDVAHHNAPLTNENFVSEGRFCVFFPGEFHKPGICVSEPAPVRKALFKIDSGKRCSG